MSKGFDWIHLAKDWDCWQAVLNTVMNFLVPEKYFFLLAQRTLTFSMTAFHSVLNYSCYIVRFVSISDR